MTPSPQQQAVIDFGLTGSGSLNLIACAGTGKTTTLIQLVKYLDGATWFCAFNKAIVSEIQYKAQQAGLSEDTVRISTVHSAGLRAWNNHLSPRKCKVEGRKVRNIIDDLAERNELFLKRGNLIGKMVELAKSAGFGVLERVGSKSAWYELIEHFGLDIEDDDDKKMDWDTLISAAIQVYNTSLKMCQKEIDFSDMLLAPVVNGAKFPKYDNILIDEAQDISPLRLRLILSCLKQGGRVIAVGDPNQAIYGFTGADAESMDTIKAHTGAIELPLTVTYRCPKVVVELAQQWVPRITAHETAPQGLHVECDLEPDKSGQVQRLNFWDMGPFTERDAVLCRNTKPLVELAYQFIRRQLPCMVEGRDIGQGLVKLATRWKLADLNALEVKLQEWKVKEIAKFESMKQEYKAEQVEDQAETLSVLIQATQELGKDRIQDLVDLIQRMFGDTLEGTKPKCLILSTVHKSKGREWPRVFILGREQYMPSKWAKQQWEKEQETNLMYVAVTRAQKELIDVRVPPKKKRSK